MSVINCGLITLSGLNAASWRIGPRFGCLWPDSSRDALFRKILNDVQAADRAGHGEAIPRSHFHGRELMKFFAGCLRKFKLAITRPYIDDGQVVVQGHNEYVHDRVIIL